jgi:hypothetical protein
MPLLPLHSHKLYSHSHKLTFCNPPLYKEREVQNKTNLVDFYLFYFIFLKKQDACHVDKLTPSCLLWKDFNDLSNLVRNANAIKLVVNLVRNANIIKLVVIVCKVLTPHRNISMYKTHGTKKKKEKKLVYKTPSMTINHCSQLVSPKLGLSLYLYIYIYI